MSEAGRNNDGTVLHSTIKLINGAISLKGGNAYQFSPSAIFWENTLTPAVLGVRKGVKCLSGLPPRLDMQLV